eukprot:3187690-Alexandrium_andersonii.AAC.1
MQTQRRPGCERPGRYEESAWPSPSLTQARSDGGCGLAGGSGEKRRQRQAPMAHEPRRGQH